MGSDAVLRDNVVIARKRHICDHCRGAIDKGTMYRSQHYVVDGYLCRFKSHRDCSDAADAYEKLIGLDRYDDRPLLHDALCDDDKEWLIKDFPTVARRFRWLSETSTQDLSQPSGTTALSGLSQCESIAAT